MVGYRHDDPITTNQKLVAGIVSGVITRCVTQPMDVIKIRTQLMRRAKKRGALKKISRRIFWEEGVMAFWHGHALGQLHSVISVGSQFFVYEMTTRSVAGLAIDESHKPALNFLCGVMAGCTSTTLAIPIEVIRVRQMLVHDQYRGFFHGAKNVYRSGGFFAFYEGLSASLLQMGPQVGISFTTFRVMQRLILNFLDDPHDKPGQVSTDANRHRPENLMLASTCAGCMAGFVSKTLTYPFDLAKKRMQIGSHTASDKYKVPSQAKKLAQCQRLSDCMYKCYQKEGFKGFFRGWTVTILKAQMTSVVAFTSYEMICYVMRKFYL
ncbi:mitochondrial thiamine pyrophosphate carrier-like [Anticarsia gemmatalis]|uniref:mitochondrial thiamine pyrophosphate carrier-like n=1 Tax=Anticarsia gemmatalis TaxID=129554 RepID=UPI003F7589DB